MPTLEDEDLAQQTNSSANQGETQSSGGASTGNSRSSSGSKTALGTSGTSSKGSFASSGGLGSKSELGSQLSPGMRSFGNRVGQYIGANRGKLSAGGGAAGLVVVILALFFALLPLKLESLMKNILADHFDGAVEHVVERRVEKILLQYIMKDSAAALGKGLPVVATGNPLTDLYRTWRTTNFEKDLADKYGLKITGNGKGKVTITSPNGTNDFQSLGDLEKYVGDNTKAATRNFIKDVISKETHWYNVVKRRHIRKWMFNAYGVIHWIRFKDSKDEKTADSNLKADLKATATDEYKARLGRDIDCIVGGSDCPDKNGERQKEIKSNQPSSGPSHSVDPFGSATQDSVDKALDTGNADEFTKKLEKTLVQEVITKLGPVASGIGLVKFVSEVDHFITSDKIDSVALDIHKAQYASVFADWTVMDDQIKSGKTVSGFDVNAALQKLNGEEGSCAFSRIYQDQTNPPAKSCVAGKPATSTIGQNIKNIYLSIVTTPGHLGLVAVYNIVHNPVFSAILNAIGSVVNWLIGLIPGMKDLFDILTKIITHGLMLLISPVVTGAETGASLMNAIDAGGDVTANDFAQQQLGAPYVPPVTAAKIDQVVANENANEAATKGLWYRIASTANPQSLLMRMASALPPTPGEAASKGVNTMFASIGSLGTNVAKLLAAPFVAGISPAFAATVTYEDPYGLTQYRYTDAQLDGAINEQDLTTAVKNSISAGTTMDSTLPTDCPNSDKVQDPKNTTPNLCMADIVAIQALKASFTDSDNGGLGDILGTNARGSNGGGTNASTTATAGSCGKFQITPNSATPPPSDYSHQSVSGVTLNGRTAAMLKTAEGYAGMSFSLTQGSYNVGVAASAGTHDGGGALDVSIPNTNSETPQITKIVQALRKAGFAAWHRFSPPFGAAHVHAMAIGDTQESSAGASQIPDYANLKDGLANHGPDPQQSTAGEWTSQWAIPILGCK